MPKVLNRFQKFSEVQESQKSEEFFKMPAVNGKTSLSWRRPCSGVIKVNCDAAVSRERSVLAVVARNDRGHMLHIHALKSLVTIPEVAELEAVLKAMHVAAWFGWSKVCVEPDAFCDKHPF